MGVHDSPQEGFSLVETIVALGILTVGVLGSASVLAVGMQNLSSSPGDVVVTQKAAQAIEAVYSARDSHRITWAQLRNIQGVSGTDGGIFLDGLQPLRLAGPDGLVATADDTTVETVTLPGTDQLLGTADDQVNALSGFARQIVITDVPNASGQLRQVVVTITYQNGPTKRSYTLTTFISSYS
jgi:type II secretory pathway pseudopilin PulG